MKKILTLIVFGFLLLSTFSMIAPKVESAGVAPEVVCVPFHGELVPHDTWINKEIILKGTAHDHDGDGTMVAYKWDFGDGFTTDWISGVDPYVIEAKHTYTGTMADGTPYSSGKYFTAWLHVKDNEGLIGKDSYFIAVRDKTLQVEVNVAIDNGLWWLHKQQSRGIYADGTENGYWYSAQGSNVAFAAASTEAFELQGHLPNGNRAEDPYVETVQRGLNWLFNQFYTYNIGQDPTYCPLGNPDINGNGIGLLCRDSRDLYDTGMVLMTISSSGAPDRIAATGSANVQGRAYKDIAQDMVDFLAWGQNDPSSGVYEGGWRYGANYGMSDNSVSQWPVIGMESAERNFGTSGVSIPSFVRPELLKWLIYSQSADGGFGYDGPSGGNTARGGAGCAMLNWTGVPTTDTRFQNALIFLDAHWFDSVQGNTNFGDYYTMYAIMKGMRIPQPNIQFIGTHDWYAEYARYIIDEQNAYGGEYVVDHSWLSGYVQETLATAWAMAILTQTLVKPGPVADAGPNVDNYPPTVSVQFDASGSYHRDPTRSIVQYEWDFESDGIWDYGGAAAEVEHAYPAVYNSDGTINWDATVKDYTATLRVTDNNDPALQDTDTRTISITRPPWKPVADPNGPYEGFTGVPVALDGSKSYAPGSKLYPPDHPWYETITKYEWDLKNDGKFNDSAEIKPSHVWDVPGVYAVGLRVTDSQPSGPSGSIGPLDVDTKYTTVILSLAVRYNLTVHVFGADANTPLSGATVSATGPENRSGITDGGTVEFGEIVQGRYDIAASKLGYKPESVKANLTENLEVTIRLAPLTRELKKDAIAELVALKRCTSNKHTLEKINKAIEEIYESLDPRLWVDDFHLDHEHGHKVFQEEKVAVGYLMEILRDKKESSAVKKVIKEIIGKLLRVDELLADTAIRDAKALGSTKPEVVHEIKEADEEFSEALQEITKGNYDKAVEEFKHAWMRAQHAMKKAFGDVNVDGKVNFRDLGILANAFGSSPGQPNWNPIADLNEDNKVNLLDYITVCKNFGNVYN